MFFVEFGAVLHRHRFSIVLTSSSGSASHLGMVLTRTDLLHTLSLCHCLLGFIVKSSWNSTCHIFSFFFVTSWSIALSCYRHWQVFIKSASITLPGKKLPTVVCNGMFFTIFINLCKHCSYPSIRCISLKNEWSIEVRSVQHWFWEEQLSLRPVWCLGHASSGKTALKKNLFTLVVDSATTVHQTIFFQ